MKESFNNRLKSIITSRNITQANLSRMTGITQSSISDWLRGIYEPKQDKVDIVARALGVSPSYLMGWEDDNKDAAREGTLNFTSENISGEEKELLETYRNFSEEGREKVLDYVRDLERTGLYIKNSENRVDKKK